MASLNKWLQSADTTHTPSFEAMIIEEYASYDDNQGCRILIVGKEVF